LASPDEDASSRSPHDSLDGALDEPVPTAALRRSASASLDSDELGADSPSAPSAPPPFAGGVTPAAKPAAGRSGTRTSTYAAPAELGSASTRASASHFACGRLASPKYARTPPCSTTVSPSEPLNARSVWAASGAGGWGDLPY